MATKLDSELTSHTPDSPVARVPVVHNPLKGWVFYDILLEGIRFKLTATPTSLFVMRGSGSPYVGEVALGPSSINYTEADTYYTKNTERTAGWYICKYKNQPRVPLEGLSEAGRYTLATEFGFGISSEYPPVTGDEIHPFFKSSGGTALIAWGRSSPSRYTLATELDFRIEDLPITVEGDHPFFKSPGFIALLASGRAHPRWLKQCIGDSYLGKWPDLVSRKLSERA